MAKRKVIRIDEARCNGCGECIPNCPEGALQIIDGKARLVSDLFCDGLGACIGYCPQEAIIVEEREAQAYNERKVIDNVVRQGANVIKAHLKHLKDHHQHEFLNQALEYLKDKGVEPGGFESQGFSCPGSKAMELKGQRNKTKKKGNIESRLGNWPVQISLVPAIAPFLQDAHLLIAADCVPFAYAGFHEDLADSRAVLIKIKSSRCLTLTILSPLPMLIWKCRVVSD